MLDGGDGDGVGSGGRGVDVDRLAAGELVAPFLAGDAAPVFIAYIVSPEWPMLTGRMLIIVLPVMGQSKDLQPASHPTDLP